MPRNDKLWVGFDSDTLLRLRVYDQLSGGVGSEFLDGGEGSDNLGGGSGEDVFVYDNADAYHGLSGFDTLTLADSDASKIKLIEFDFYSIEMLDLENGVSNSIQLNFKDIL